MGNQGEINPCNDVGPGGSTLLVLRSVFSLRRMVGLFSVRERKNKAPKKRTNFPMMKQILASE